MKGGFERRNIVSGRGFSMAAIVMIVFHDAPCFTAWNC